MRITLFALRAAAFSFALGITLPALAASVWTDGSGTITTAGTAQTIFSSVTNGFMVCSNYGTLWIDDINTANYVKSIPVRQGECFWMPIATAPTVTNVPQPGSAALTIIGPSVGAGFVARKW